MLLYSSIGCFFVKAAANFQMIQRIVETDVINVPVTKNESKS